MMRAYIYALVFTGTTSFVHATDRHLPPSPRTTTSGPNYAGDKRADPTASITLGPSADFVVSLTSGASKPAGTGFTMVPAGDKASDGANLTLGSDLKSKMESALQANCGDTKSPDCHNAILDLLPIEQAQLQRRQFGLLFAAGIGLRYVFAGIILAYSAKKVLDGYHASGSNLVLLDPPTVHSAYAIIPSVSASPTVLKVQPSNTPDPVPSVSSGDGKNFTINAPQELAQRTDDLAGQPSGGCPAPRIKRALAALRLGKRDDLDPELVACLLVLTVELVRNMVTGPLAQWVRVNLNNRNVAPAGAGAAVVLAEAENQLAPLQQQVDLPQQQWQAIRNMAYWEAFNRLVRLRQDGQVVKISEDDINLQYCPPKKNLDCANQSCKGSNGKCADSPLEGCDCGAGDDEDNGSCDAKVQTACDNCGGDDGKSRCRGVGRKLKGCGCWASEQRTPALFKTSSDLKAVQQALLSFKELPDPPPEPTDGEDAAPPPPHCELRKRAGADISTDFFKSLINAACKGISGEPDSSFDKKLTDKDADPKYQNEFNGIQLTSYGSIFSRFVNGAPSQCTPDSHSMGHSGTMELDCGTAKFTISETESASDPLSQCPEVYPVNDTQDNYRKWWDNNHCNKKCPNAQFTCTDGFNDDIATCVCKDETCANANPSQSTCANQDKSNPW